MHLTPVAYRGPVVFRYFRGSWKPRSERSTRLGSENSANNHKTWPLTRASLVSLRENSLKLDLSVILSIWMPPITSTDTDNSRFTATIQAFSS